MSLVARVLQQVMNSHDQLLEMRVCLRGPGTEPNQAALRAMLSSVRLTP